MTNVTVAGNAAGAGGGGAQGTPPGHNGAGGGGGGIRDIGSVVLNVTVTGDWGTTSETGSTRQVA